MDGLMDTADALASCQPVSKKLEILKDPHAGAFAVIHYFIQTSSGHDSITGTVLMASMVVTVSFGAAIKLIRGTVKKKLLVAHRCVVVFVLVMGILHLLVH